MSSPFRLPFSENRSGAYAVVMNSRSGFGWYNTNWVSFYGPTLRNLGINSATGVTATLSCADGYVN